MLARLPAEAEVVADRAAGWAGLPGGGAAARGLGALAARCVGAVASDRPSIAEVGLCGGRRGMGIRVSDVDRVLLVRWEMRAAEG